MAQIATTKTGKLISIFENKGVKKDGSKWDSSRIYLAQPTGQIDSFGIKKLNIDDCKKLLGKDVELAGNAFTFEDGKIAFVADSIK